MVCRRRNHSWQCKLNERERFSNAGHIFTMFHLVMIIRMTIIMIMEMWHMHKVEVTLFVAVWALETFQNVSMNDLWKSHILFNLKPLVRTTIERLPNPNPCYFYKVLTLTNVFFFCFVLPIDKTGICTDLVNNYTCSCNVGFTGRDCDIVVTTCTADSCFPNVTCSNNSHTIVCGPCPLGFSGDGKNCRGNTF